MAFLNFSLFLHLLNKVVYQGTTYPSPWYTCRLHCSRRSRASHSKNSTFFLIFDVVGLMSVRKLANHNHLMPNTIILSIQKAQSFWNSHIAVRNSQSDPSAPRIRRCASLVVVRAGHCASKAAPTRDNAHFATKPSLQLSQRKKLFKSPHFPSFSWPFPFSSLFPFFFPLLSYFIIIIPTPIHIYNNGQN